MENQAFQLLMARLREIENRLDDQDIKLDQLLSWRWKLAGATLVLSTIGGIAVQMMIAKLNN